MTQDEARRFLRLIRFSTTKGRSFTMTWVAARCGYSREHLHRAAMHGSVSERLAKRVGRAFQSVIDGQNQITLSSLGEYGGPDPRGGPRPARRPDDGRLRAARLLRGRLRGNASPGPYGGADDQGGAVPHGGGGDFRGGPRPARRPDDRRLRSARASRDTSGANSSRGPYGARPENPHPCDHYGGGTVQIGLRGAGRPSQHTPPVTGTPDAVEHVLEQGPTNQATIRIDVGRLLTKQLDSSQNRRGGSDFTARRP